MGCARGQKAIRTPEMPPFSDEQLDYLDSLYPEKCPDPKASGRDIWMAVGQRSVVTRLRSDERRREDRQRKSTDNKK